MGFLDEIKKLTQPFDDEEDEFFDDDEASTRIPVSDKPQPPAEHKSRFSPAPAADKKSTFFSDDGTYDAPKPAFGSRKESIKREGNVVNLSGGGQLKVALVKPERFESAAEIADHLREKRTVVMNLETTPKDTARRLIDFLSGVAYAQDGKIRRVANNTYLITPYNVDLMGDVIDELENTGLYF